MAIIDFWWSNVDDPVEFLHSNNDLHGQQGLGKS